MVLPVRCNILDAPAPRPGLDDPELRQLIRRGEAGYVHSTDSGSTLDGPGVRYVLWTTGCAMRCQYCHNPDTMKLIHGEVRRVDEIVKDVERFAPFLAAAGGGFTVTGGEPLVQAEFTLNLLRTVKQSLGLHTTLDTNGLFGNRLTDAELETADLILLDLKSFDAETHQRVTGVDNAPILEFARRLAELGKPAWVRFVLVPGLTDGQQNVNGLARFVATLDNVERVEVLPFHQMGRDKWKRLGQPYPLEETKPPTPEEVARCKQIFADAGITVA